MKELKLRNTRTNNAIARLVCCLVGFIMIRIFYEYGGEKFALSIIGGWVLANSLNN